MITQKKFVQGDSIDLACPECRASKTVPIAALKGKFSFKAKCPCGVIFRVQLEFRKRFRKQTSLPAHYELVGEQTTWGNVRWESHELDPRDINCRITNISAHGLGFTTQGGEKLGSGDVIRIVFALDNSAQTMIEKKIIVRMVKGNSVGCEFDHRDKGDTKIGFYLL